MRHTTRSGSRTSRPRRRQSASSACRRRARTRSPQVGRRRSGPARSRRPCTGARSGLSHPRGTCGPSTPRATNLRDPSTRFLRDPSSARLTPYHGDLMQIERAEVIVTSPGRNFVTLRLTTSDQVQGVGDATVNGRELAVGSYLQDHVCPLLIGRDPQQIEDIWQYLYRGGYWRRGPVTMAAIAAVDVALWDIKAKLAGMPLYQLLGGASRKGLLAYGHASGPDIPSLFGSIDEHLQLGYRAIRIQTGVPGLGSVYGVATGGGSGPRYDYEPARRTAVPTEESWDTRAYLRHVPTVFEAVRDKVGP